LVGRAGLEPATKGL